MNRYDEFKWRTTASIARILFTRAQLKRARILFRRIK